MLLPLTFNSPFVDEEMMRPGHWFLPTRRYASAVLAVIVCPSVCHKLVFY